MDFKLAAYQEFRALLSHGFLQDIRERYLVRCAENVKAHNDVYFSLHIMVCLIVAYRIPVLGDKVCDPLGSLCSNACLVKNSRALRSQIFAAMPFFASAMRCYLFCWALLIDMCLFAQNPELHTPPAVVQTMETKFALRDIVVADIVHYQRKACARYTQLCEESMMEVCHVNGCRAALGFTLFHPHLFGYFSKKKCPVNGCNNACSFDVLAANIGARPCARGAASTRAGGQGAARLPEGAVQARCLARRIYTRAPARRHDMGGVRQEVCVPACHR
jgi:hypothetical protein